VLSFLYLIDFKILPPYDTNFSMSYPPKERFFKNLSEGSHLFECSLSFILLISKFYPPATQTFRRLILQRRGSLKNLTEGSHLFECSLSFILLISKLYPPTTQTFRRLIVWVGLGPVWCGSGAYFVFHFFFCKIALIFLIFFFKCV